MAPADLEQGKIRESQPSDKFVGCVYRTRVALTTRVVAARRPATLDLFAEPGKESVGVEWPAAGRFPLNEDTACVESTVLEDLESSTHPLVVTGFATLARLIDFVGQAEGCTARLQRPARAPPDDCGDQPASKLFTARSPL